jgi:hypothetical protein
MKAKRKRSWLILIYCPSICLKGLKKTGMTESTPEFEPGTAPNMKAEAYYSGFALNTSRTRHNRYYYRTPRKSVFLVNHFKARRKKLPKRNPNIYYQLTTFRHYTLLSTILIVFLPSELISLRPMLLLSTYLYGKVSQVAFFIQAFR